MDRTELQKLWNEMWSDGSWVPAWSDSLTSLDANHAAWSPAPGSHSVWQEVVHVTFWRRATLNQMVGSASPTEDEVRALEFAAPDDPNSPQATDEAWAAAVTDLTKTQEAIAAALADEKSGIDLERVQCHLIHDAYHLGRITFLRAMRGTPPPF